MGNTSYYAIPYPEQYDIPDGAAQMKAIADAIETLLKNGYTIPGGDLVLGETTGTVARVLAFRKTEAPDAYQGDMYVMSGGTFVMRLSKNGTEVNRLRLLPDGSLVLAVGSGYARPVPYATYAWQGQVTITNAASANVVVTYPTGRFTVSAGVYANGPATYAMATGGGSSAYVAVTSSNSNTGTTITLRHINDTVATATIWVSLLAIQMAPTRIDG